MKKTIQVSVDLEPWAELKARGENISEICNQTIINVAGTTTTSQTTEELKKELDTLNAKQAILKVSIQKQEEEKKTENTEADLQKAAREAHARRQRRPDGI